MSLRRKGSFYGAYFIFKFPFNNLMQFYSDLSFTDKKLDIKYVVFAKVTLAL